jgi:hypothetical protein
MSTTNLERDHAEYTMHMGHGVPPKTAAAHMSHDRHAGLGGDGPGQILADFDPHASRRPVVD